MGSMKGKDGSNDLICGHMNMPKKTIIVSATPAGAGKLGNAFEVGLLLNFSQEKKGGLAIELVMVTSRKEERSYQRIPLSGTNYLPYLSRLPLQVAGVLRKLTDDALVEYLVKKGHGWLRDAGKPWDNLSEHHYILLRQWISDVLEELKPLVPAIRHIFYLPAGEIFTTHTIKPAAFSSFTLSLQFVLERAGNWLRLKCQ